MAVAFDASAAQKAIGTTNTFAHTCSGSNRILYVWICEDGLNATNDLVTGVTYNGVSMTQIKKLLGNGAAPKYTYLYMLVAPATGAHNVIVTASSSVGINSISYSVTGANQSISYGSTDNLVTDLPTIDGTSQALTVATVADNSWVVYFNWMDSTTTNNREGDANTTFVIGLATRQYGVWDCSAHGVVTPAGNYTMTVNTNGGVDVTFEGASIIISISPPSAAANGNFLAFF